MTPREQQLRRGLALANQHGRRDEASRLAHEIGLEQIITRQGVEQRQREAVRQRYGHMNCNGEPLARAPVPVSPRRAEYDRLTRTNPMAAAAYAARYGVPSNDPEPGPEAA